MKHKTSKPKASRKMAPATFSPATARDGDRFMVRLAQPLRGTALPEITIGGKALLAPMLIDPRTIVGEVAPDSAGRKRIVVGRGRGMVSPPGTLLHGGKRRPPRKRSASAWLNTLHYEPGLSRDRPHADLTSPWTLDEVLNPTQPASNWWMQGANASHDAHVVAAGGPPLHDAWQFTATDPETLRFAEPVLSGNMLLLAPTTLSREGEILLALDAATGLRRWIWQTPSDSKAIVQTPPLCVGSRIYVVKQIERPAGSRTTLLVCADAVTGSPHWQVALPSGNWNGMARLAAGSRLVYVMTYDATAASLFAFEPLSGRLVWRREGEIPIAGFIGTCESIAVAFGSVIVGSSNGLRSYDATTGEARHSWPIDFDCSHSPIVVSHGKGQPLVIAGDNGGRVRAFNADTHRLIWKFDGEMANQFIWARMACDRQRLYVMQERTLVALDVATGRPGARSPDLGDRNMGAPALGRNCVFQVAHRSDSDPASVNRLLCLDPSDISQVLAMMAVGGIVNTVRPVLDGPRLYLNLSMNADSFDQNVVKAIRVG